VGTSAPVETVSHALYPVAQHLKTPLLIELLRRTDTRSVLVFTRTKHRAKRLGSMLEDAGFKAVSLQGNLSQSRRQAAMDGFRSGAFQILVATDIAARGIDVSTISHVINFDIPDTADAYTHRIGRTGRVDRTGDAFTLVTQDDEGEVRAIERLLGARIERRTLAGFDYDRSPPPKFPDAPRQQRSFGRGRAPVRSRGYGRSRELPGHRRDRFGPQAARW
jgi:ATP-dependent RNA helicase RhlE